jgi:PII-like signaling protein
MTEPVTLFLIFVNEADTCNEARLYQALVYRWRQLKLAAATAQAGTLRFGHYMRLHHRAYSACRMIGQSR